MPALCSFTDLHTISLLLYKSPTEFWYKTFPYVYSSSMFSSSFSEDAFYQNLFSNFCKEHGVALSECDILLTGFLEAPRVNFPVKLSKSLFEVFTSVSGFYPILINNTSVFSKDFCYALSSLKQQSGADADEDNYYANLGVYPQLVTNDISTQIDLDSNIVNLLKERPKMPTSDVPIVFCGSRFSRESHFPELDYLLLLSTIQNPGIYNIKVDTGSSLILNALLQIHDQNIKLNPNLIDVGLVISSGYSVECKIQSGSDSSKLIHVHKDKTVIEHLQKDADLKIMVRSKDIGTIETSIKSRGLGLIFDTRKSKNILAKDVGVFSKSLKSFADSALKQS